MARPVRLFAIAALAVAVCFTTGCQSNNTTKILGKWKLVESPGFNSADGRAFTQLGLYATVDFMPDGSMNISIESDNPGVMARVAHVTPGGKTTFKAKYSLGFGDNVMISDIDKDFQQFIRPGRWEVTIKGGYMSVRTADGIEKYERLSAYVAPEAKTR